MPYRSDDEELEKTEEERDTEKQTSQLLTLFNFYWLKFLSQKRVLDQERKLLEHEVHEMENEEKIKSMRSTISDISST